MATTPRPRPVGTFPAGRMRQAGATADELHYWRDVLDSLDADGRAELLDEWEAMDRGQLAQAVKLSVTGVPDGAGAPAAPAEPQAPQPSDHTDTAPPDGNVDTVRRWVLAVEGARRIDRAQAALDAELARPTDDQRSTLVQPLKELTRRG